MVELHEPALVASMATGSDECASPQVAQPDRSLHRRGWRPCCGLGDARRRWALRRRHSGVSGHRRPPGLTTMCILGLRRVREFLLQQLRQQRRVRAVQDGGVVAGRNGVAKHVLRQTGLLEGRPADRDLKLVTVRRERRHRRRRDRTGDLRQERERSRKRRLDIRSGIRGSNRHGGHAVRDGRCGPQGGRRRKAPHRTADVGLWEEAGHHLLDLGLPLATGGPQDLAVVGWSEVGREEPDRCEAHRSFGEQLKNHGGTGARLAPPRCGYRLPTPRGPGRRGSRCRATDSPPASGRHGYPALGIGGGPVMSGRRKSAPAKSSRGREPGIQRLPGSERAASERRPGREVPPDPDGEPCVPPATPCSPGAPGRTGSGSRPGPRSSCRRPRTRRRWGRRSTRPRPRPRRRSWRPS